MNRNRWLLLSFLFLGFALYGPFLGNPFMMDDEIQILGNPEIQDITKLPSYFTSSTMGSGGAEKMGGIYYKPLLTSYYGVVWHFFGPNPIAYRVPVLLLHCLSAALLFLLFLRFLPLWGAYFVGLVFLVHPVNAEVVLYIADAQDVLYLFFGLLALLAVDRLQKRAALFSVLCVLLLFSLLSKETGALFLPFVLLYAWLFERKKMLPVFSAAGLVGGAYAAARLSMGFTEVHNNNLIFHHALWTERLLTLPTLLWHYVEIYLFPWRLSLATDFVIRRATLGNFWLPLTGFLAFFAGLVWLLKPVKGESARLAAFLGAVLAFWFLLHSHVFFPLDGVYADRWFYLCSWALTGLVVLGFFLRGWLDKRAAIAGALILAALFGRSYARAWDWTQPLRLYTREYAVHPWDAIMANNVGVELFRAGDPAAAKPYFLAAIERNPYWSVAANNWGAVLEAEGNFPEALAAYERAIVIGHYPLAFENYGKLLLRMGRIEEARQFLENVAIPLLPKNPELRRQYSQLPAQPLF